MIFTVPPLCTTVYRQSKGRSEMDDFAKGIGIALYAAAIPAWAYVIWTLFRP